ncbi:hypothetical protein HG536_0D03310 [Torulaspora globosa]|uniref:Maf-like protein n=1 Tax=Torulaspora globosa TaxID=48254 RepID=A0A7G3ZH23_9SACH|nr:uncharacterized protein HG536_0D03310 [Torulaspora globosa]QLL32809.1 hypothetical protein HG536_0D03310 [Torulaspora globosa]
MPSTTISEQIQNKFDVILASSSPRRYQILHDVMGLRDLKLMKPSFEEDLDKALYRNDPIRYVRDTSFCKAQGIAKDLEAQNDAKDPKEKLIICADTIVIDTDNIIYEKPGTKDAQLANLKKFCYSDKGHPLRVATAVTVIRWRDGKNYDIRDPFHEITELYCDGQIPIELLEEYVESGEGVAVAGGLMIQGISGIVIKTINGDYNNVVGLPLNRTFQAIYQELNS